MSAAALATLAGQAPPGSFFDTPAWYGALTAAALDPGTEPLFLAPEASPGTPRAILPLMRGRPRPGFRLPMLASLTNAYSCEYAVVTGGVPLDRAAARSLVDLVRAERRRALVLDTLAVDDPALPLLEAAFHRKLWATQRYFHFGNWFERIDAGYEAYLLRRPGQLRSTLARKGKRAGDFVFRIVEGRDELGDAVTAYETVYAKSWKPPEPYPDFARVLVHAAATAGALRLGIASLDGAPVAAQIWLLHPGRATIFKLAYDEATKARSPGTLLTAHMMRHVIERDGVREVDFGRGDDDYKRSWLGERRERIGLVAIDPTAPSGLLAALRHVALPRLRGARRRQPAVDAAENRAS